MPIICHFLVKWSFHANAIFKPPFPIHGVCNCNSVPAGVQRKWSVRSFLFSFFCEPFPSEMSSYYLISKIHTAPNSAIKRV